MELTQRLECTQQLYNIKSEKTSPEQIGFLGICGAKYPLKKGPNKIGRDPETCNIVLNLNSISRQHAVINILNSHEFMLMDLDSANKTKLADKTLEAYIPHPLKNGDMVQFGQVFGVFRLLEEENDLPMTQAIEIPDTPVPTRHVSKLNNVHTTTIPESPDVSDKDDSIIASSQHKSRHVFKSPNNNFLIPSGKTISIKPVGSNKIDNVYWSSSKKSDSFSIQSDISGDLDNSVSLSTSHTNIAKQSIHELNTQVPYIDQNETVDSIYNANTQVMENAPTPNIYDMETQVPSTQNLSEICKIRDQRNLAFNYYTDNKENENNLFNADTQVINDPKPGSPRGNENLNPVKAKASTSKDIHNTSDDVILFDEIDSELLQDDFNSQPLLSPKLNVDTNDRQSESEEKDTQSEKLKIVSRTRANRLKSDSSTDCEDIFMVVTQEIPKTKDIDENSTDCEDEPNLLKSNKNLKNCSTVDDDVTDCEDELNDIDFIQPNKPLQDDKFEDLPTQILEDSKVDEGNQVVDTDCLIRKSNLEEPPTQIIEYKNGIENVSRKKLHAETQNNIDFAEALTQKIYSEEIVRFKVPFQSPFKKKKTYDINTTINKCTTTTEIVDNNDDQYYNATQELFNDLCSQKSLSPEVKAEISNNLTKNSFDENNLMNKEHCIKVKNRISIQEHNIVGVQNDLIIYKTVSSDASDQEITPKKINCHSILDIKLPDTQEIKNAAPYVYNISDTESLSDNNECELDNERRIPKKLQHGSKRNNKIKINLSEKFDPGNLPVRSSTRVKKLTEKVKLSESAKRSNNIIANSSITENDIKDHHTTAKNIKKVEQKENKELSRSENTKETNKININERKTKSSASVTKERNSKDDANNSRKTRSHKKNIIHNISPEKEKSKSENKYTLRKSNRKTSKEKCKSPVKEQSKSELKSIMKKPNNDLNKLESETDVRRSKRNRSGKKSEESSSNNSNTKPINHEQSRVYSVVVTSSDSGTDSPNKLKRQANREFDMPNAKKSRAAVKNCNSSAYRATPARKVKTHHVLFTAFPSEEVKDKLERLGAIIVSDVMACTVVLTLEIKRTFKLLCAVGLGKPIVGPMWVQACVDTNMIVDPWLYLIDDGATEKRFQFNLQRTLSGKRDFLKGYNISSTPSVMPRAAEMKLIVECSGGNWKDDGHVYQPNWLCVSAPADRSLWAGLKRKGAVVVSTELILGGVLRQKLDIDKNKLI